MDCEQVVDGSNGAKARGDSWPAFHKSTVHASPLTYDFDFDNVQDIMVATFDGEILFFKDTVIQLQSQSLGQQFATSLPISVFPSISFHSQGSHVLERIVYIKAMI